MFSQPTRPMTRSEMNDKIQKMMEERQHQDAEARNYFAAGHQKAINRQLQPQQALYTSQMQKQGKMKAEEDSKAIQEKRQRHLG